MKFFSGAIEAEGFDEATALMRQRVGANLRKLREMKGLSLMQVQEGCGYYSDDQGRLRPVVSSETLRNYENGETSSYEKYWALADFYGVTLGALGGRIDYEPAAEMV